MSLASNCTSFECQERIAREEAERDEARTALARMQGPVEIKEVMKHIHAGDMSSTQPQRIKNVCRAILAARAAGEEEK
jgi:hypothetical protein